MKFKSLQVISYLYLVTYKSAQNTSAPAKRYLSRRADYQLLVCIFFFFFSTDKIRRKGRGQKYKTRVDSAIWGVPFCRCACVLSVWVISRAVTSKSWISNSPELSVLGSCVCVAWPFWTITARSKLFKLPVTTDNPSRLAKFHSTTLRPRKLTIKKHIR